MTEDSFQKGYEYSRVRVSETDSLEWVKEILWDLNGDQKLTAKEWENLYTSLGDNNNNE